jgi:hypothetical protein
MRTGGGMDMIGIEKGIFARHLMEFEVCGRLEGMFRFSTYKMVHFIYIKVSQSRRMLKGVANLFLTQLSHLASLVRENPR